MKRYSRLILSIHLLLLPIFCNAQYNVLLSFNGTNGEVPLGSLTPSGNVFYGLTGNGGVNGDGNIFSINSDGSGYKDLFNFNSSNGLYPDGSLTLSGNKLYGMTSSGGTSGNGEIFSIDTSGNGFTILLYFTGTNGAGPGGDLTYVSGILYGMTFAGGANNDGCIFSIDTNGNDYKDIFDFNGLNGLHPQNSLTLSGSTLYGMTCYGGVNGHGNIFSIDTNGNGFKDMFDFNGTNGANPFGNLTLSGAELYGMTAVGGDSNAGVIFSIDTNGQGYKVLLNCTMKQGGYSSSGDLLVIDSIIYGGTDINGGIYGDGSIFSIDTNGSNYTDLFDFNGNNGQDPVGLLTLSRNIFYGMTGAGGVDDYGVVFSFRDTIGDLAINNLKATEGAVNVYPNPNNGQFTLSVSKVNEKCNFEIYNVLGESIDKAKIISSNTQINLGSQPEGIYFYRVLKEDGEFVGSGKVIIEK